MHYDLMDLRVFLAVVDEGNLSRGAQRCNLAPSSVSLRIKDLEATFGSALLQRKPRGVAPTAAGLVLAEHARRCLAQLEQMHADLQPFAHGITGRVVLFANNNAISSFLPDDLGRFLGAHPAVRITLEERNSNDVIAAVAQGRADLGVVVTESEHPALAFFPYRSDELVMLVPLDSPLRRGGRAIRFAECLGEPFVSLQPGAAIHTFLLNHASALGARLDIRIRVSGYRAIARLVASGAGIGVVPRSALEPGDDTRLAVLALDEPWARRELRICVRRDAEPHFWRDALVRELRAPPAGGGAT